MNDLNRKRILSAVSAEDFIGRTRELDALLAHAKGERRTGGLLILSAPTLGASELLRQTYDKIFAENGETIPLYFALKKSDKTAKQASIRFLQTFLQQTIAFRRQDAKIFDTSHEICELAEIAPPSDGYWIDRIVETCLRVSRLNDERGFIRQALSAPLRAAANNANFFVMIDNLHEAEDFTGELNFIEELGEIYARSSVKFVFAGHRRFIFDKFHGNYESLELQPLSFTEAGLLAENLAENSAVKINEQTRDLIAVKFGGNPLFIRLILQAASKKGKDLSSFQRVEQFYADEIFGGRIAKFYDAIFDEISPNIETQKNFSGLLFDALTIEKEKSAIESWQRRSGLSAEDFYRAMRFLNDNEIIRVSSNLVFDLLARDHVQVREVVVVVLLERGVVVAL